MITLFLALRATHRARSGAVEGRRLIMGLMTWGAGWSSSPTAILFAVLGMNTSLAQTPPAGQLKCDVEGGVSYILGIEPGNLTVHADRRHPGILQG